MNIPLPSDQRQFPSITATRPGPLPPRCDRSLLTMSLNTCGQYHDTDLDAWLGTLSISKDTVLTLSSSDPYDSHLALRHAQNISSPDASVLVTAPASLLSNKAFAPFLTESSLVHHDQVIQTPHGTPIVNTVRVCAKIDHVHSTYDHFASFDGRVAGRSSRIVLDTGATISCVTQSFIKSCGVTITPDTQPIEGIGGAIVPLGRCTLSVKFGKFSCEQEFLVVDKPVSGYHCLLGQSFLHHSYASLLFSPTSVCFSVGNGKNKATFARKIDKASPYLKQQNCYVMSTTTSEPAQPSPMSHRERKKLYRHLNAGRTVGYRMVLTVASKSSTSSLATSLEPEIQKVIDKHSGPGGTLCGKIPDHTAAKGFQCHLNIHPDAHPSFCKQYRLTPMEKEDLLTQVEAFIAKGWIEPSVSPWSSSVLFIPKPNGKLRFCVDYRRLNAVTVGDQGPVPLTGELLDSLGGSVYFSALDLASGYYQLGMHPDSRPYTAFPTPYGLYQWKVMPMGLKTAPAIFQRAMNSILHTHIKAGRCLVYLCNACTTNDTVGAAGISPSLQPW